MTSTIPDAACATLLDVDNPPPNRRLLAESRGMHGYHFKTAASARGMETVLAHHSVSLVLPDVMMPGEDGPAACRRFSTRSGSPIVMLSAPGDEPDRILGLKIDASYYLSKPWSPREILATVRAGLRERRSPGEREAQVFAFLDRRVDFSAHELLDADRTLVDLTESKFAILRALFERPRRILARNALLEMARGLATNAFDRATDLQVTRLRRKLRSCGNEISRTMRNDGYFIVPRVART